MKKLISMCLCLALLCLAGCAAAVGAEELTGEWFLYSFQVGETEPINPSETGVSVSIDLRPEAESFAAVLTANGVSQTGSWTLEGSTVKVFDAAGNQSAYLWNDGVLLMIKGDTMMIFSREQPEALTRPVAIAAEKVEDFYGSWKGSVVYSSTMFLKMDEIGMEMRIDIDEKGLSEITDEGESVKVLYDFVNGQLEVRTTDGQLAMLFQLNEDGTISLSDEAASVWFVRDEAAEAQK